MSRRGGRLHLDCTSLARAGFDSLPVLHSEMRTPRLSHESYSQLTAVQLQPTASTLLQVGATGLTSLSLTRPHPTHNVCVSEYRQRPCRRQCPCQSIVHGAHTVVCTRKAWVGMRVCMSRTVVQAAEPAAEGAAPLAHKRAAAAVATQRGVEMVQGYGVVKQVGQLGGKPLLRYGVRPLATWP